MKTLVDIVNFNADASCLSSKRWLEALKGKHTSTFCEWLKLFVALDKKVVLGLTGATVADIAIHNPEAINFINKHTDLFEIILRPFTHDIALLRVEGGFATNFTVGYQVISNEFKNISSYFLPPEFMITSHQLLTLHNNNVTGLFINPDRFSKDIRPRIPSRPYRVKGLFGIYLNCIPIRGKLTYDYLDALHKFDFSGWNKNILAEDINPVFTWRDGESMLFIPDGLDREACWLKNEDNNIHRKHIKVARLDFMSNDDIDDPLYRSYPVHSFLAWMKEFKVLGFVNKVRKIEESLLTLTERQKSLWLKVISSDILSAIEKRSPVVQIREDSSSNEIREFTIQRSERGFEGEEYLAILETAITTNGSIEYVDNSQDAHITKLRGRIEYLSKFKCV